MLTAIIIDCLNTSMLSSTHFNFNVIEYNACILQILIYMEQLMTFTRKIVFHALLRYLDRYVYRSLLQKNKDQRFCCTLL